MPTNKEHLPAWARGLHTVTVEFETGEPPITVVVPNTEFPEDMTAAGALVYLNEVVLPNAAPALIEAIRASFVRDLDGDPRLEYTAGNA